MTDVAGLLVEVDSSQVKKARDENGRFVESSKKVDKANKIAKDSFKALAGLAGIGSVTVAFLKVIDVHRQYTAALSDLSAITGAVGADLEFYNEQAKLIGETTTLSSTQAAEAFKLIASAKPDLLESKEALASVTREAVSLAEASGLTMPQAAKALGSSLNQFSADADEASRFINVLAAGAKFGASEIEETSMALKVAGTVASDLGLSFEEANAAIQAMAAVSIKGSEAGTGLRGVLLKLATQSRTEFNPEIVGLSTALNNLADANLTTTEKTKLFGLESITTASALILQADKIDALTQSLTDTEVAYDQASAKVDNLDGDLKILGSTYESIALVIGEKLDPALRGVTQFIVWMSKPIKTLILEFSDLGDLIGAFAAAAGAVASFDISGAQAILEARREQREEVDATIAAIWEEKGAHDENADAISGEIDEIEKKNKLNKKTKEAIDAELRAAKLLEAQLNKIWKLEEEAAKETAKAQKEAAKELEKYNRELDSLRRNLDPVGSMMRDYVRQWELIEKAVTRGDMGVEEARQLKLELQDVVEDGLKPFNDELDSTFDKTSTNISMITAGFASLQGVFRDGSDGLKMMQDATHAANAVQAVHAVLNQASGDPYTAFSRMAAMASAVAQLGYSTGALGGGGSTNLSSSRQTSQGTGSVFGDVNAKSESISKAIEITSEATSELVGINRGMLDALGKIQLGIEGAAIGIVGGMEFPSIDDFISSLDHGLEISGGKISEMLVQSYTDAWGQDGIGGTTKLAEDVGKEVADDFASILASISDSVSEGAIAIGMSAEEVEKAISNFVMEDISISLAGMTGEEQQEAISEVFSKIFDDLAENVVPLIDEFRKIGEGAGETLARLAAEVQTVDVAMSQLGFTMSDDTTEGIISASNALIEFSGGIEKFASDMKGFIDKFASDERKFEIVTNSLTDALEQQGMTVPDTRDGFMELMEAQDASTESGAKNIATLLMVQDAADEYYSFLEESEREALAIAEETAAAELKLIEEKKAAEEDAIQSAIRAAEELAEEISKRNKKRTDDALESLKKAVDVEKKELDSAYKQYIDLKKDALAADIAVISIASDAQIGAIKEQEAVRLNANSTFLDSAKLGLADIKGEFKAIKSARESLSGVGIDLIESQRSALLLLSRAVSTGDLTGAGQAARIASGIKEGQFSSRIDYLRQLSTTKGLLERLESEGFDQLTIAEQTVARISEQSDIIKSESRSQIDAIKQASELRIKELNEIYDGDVSRAKGYHDAEINRLDLIVDKSESQVESLRGIDSSILSIDESISILLGAIASEDSNITGSGIPVLSRSGIASELSSELRSIREEIKAGNLSVAKNTLKTAKILEKFDFDGMPSDRAY